MAIKNKYVFISLIAALTMLQLAFEYLQGGVVTHYPLADPNNPGISNWWGLVTLPVLAWTVLFSVERSNARENRTTQPASGILLQRNHLLGGFAFGLLMGVLWEFGLEGMLQYIVLLPWVFALFLRIYLPETTLGFVLGMMYTFGGVLPIAFAVVIQTIGYLIYTVFNRGGKWLFAKFS